MLDAVGPEILADQRLRFAGVFVRPGNGIAGADKKGALEAAVLASSKATNRFMAIQGWRLSRSYLIAMMCMMGKMPVSQM